MGEESMGESGNRIGAAFLEGTRRGRAISKCGSAVQFRMPMLVFSWVLGDRNYGAHSGPIGLRSVPRRLRTAKRPEAPPFRLCNSEGSTLLRWPKAILRMTPPTSQLGSADKRYHNANHGEPRLHQREARR